MRSEGRAEIVLSHHCAMKPAQGWGTHNLVGPSEFFACRRERSGWRWELFSI